MQAFGVLDRYIGKTIFNTIMMTLFMLVSLSGIIKFVDQLKKSGQERLRCAGRWSLHHPQRAEGHPDLLPNGGAAWRAAGAGDAGPAQRTGGDAGIRFHPAAGSAGGNENRDPAGAADHGHRRVGGAAGRTDGAQLPCPADVRRLAALNPAGAVGERWPQLCLYRTRKRQR